jgi:hypothetical protein
MTNTASVKTYYSNNYFTLTVPTEARCTFRVSVLAPCLLGTNTEYDPRKT